MGARVGGVIVRAGIGERLYRRVLRLYPTEFRDRFSDDMIQLFHDKLRDARAGRAPGGTAGAWFRMLGDVAGTAPSEHLRRNRTMAHSLAASPSIQARALGIAGILAGLATLIVYIVELPAVASGVRLILLLVGSLAIVAGVHRRQASVAPVLARIGAGVAIVGVGWYLVMSLISMLARTGSGGAFGVTYFLAGIVLWLSIGLFGLVTLRNGAVTRLGAFALVIGAPLALSGIDRLGLASEAAPTIFNALSQVGIAVVGVGWILLGLDVAMRRPSRQPMG